KEQGLPSGMLLTGSAREADVRAERLHRYLTEKDAPALPGKVIVDVGGQGKLSVVLEIPAEKVPTLEDLRNIATNVTTSTLKAVPEAQLPDEIVTIEVRSGKHKVGTWENGGWKLEELPPAVKEFKKQIKQ
ncbi:MAG: hypothetical protein AB1405_14640, partial [Bdellovibrionota bacterium]